MRKYFPFILIILIVFLLGVAGKFPYQYVILGDSSGAELSTSTRNGVTLLDAHLADFHHTLVDENFHLHSGGDSTMDAAGATAGDISFDVDDATNFADGDFIHIQEGNTNEAIFPEITDVTGTTITIDRPLDNTYTTLADVEEVDIDLQSTSATLGANRDYCITPPPDEVWHIVRVLIASTSPGEPDDADFMGIAAIENGLVIRQVLSTGTRALANFKTGGGMASHMYDVTYAQRSGGGDWGTRGRWTFKKNDVVIVLNGAVSDQLCAVVQDDLTALTGLTMVAQGHIEGE